MKEELQVHGSIFLLIKEFVETNYDNNTWLNLNKLAEIGRTNYGMHENYPAYEMFSIIRIASDHLKISENELKEKFGEFLAPHFLNTYKTHINPEWKTFEILENTELVLHKTVRKQEPNAEPPVLNISRVHDKLLIIDYYSKRKMASLAVGIIRGIAGYFDEREKILIIQNTNPDDERVQIRIEFK